MSEAERAEQRRRARPFLCRWNLWHHWEERRVQLLHSGIQTTMKVCTRCRTAKGWR